MNPPVRKSGSFLPAHLPVGEPAFSRMFLACSAERALPASSCLDAEPEDDDGPALEVVDLLALVEAGLGVGVGGVDEPLPVAVGLVGREGERDRLVVGVEEDQDRLADDPVAVVVDVLDQVARQPDARRTGRSRRPSRPRPSPRRRGRARRCP